MRERPISTSPVVRQRRFSSVSVTEAYLIPRVVEQHQHPAPHFSFLVEGSYEEWVDGRRFLCRSGDVLLKPAGIPHSDTFKTLGCSVIVEVSDRARWDLAVLSEPRLVKDPRVFGLFTQLRRELGDVVPGADLVFEGLVLEILGLVTNHQADIDPFGGWLSTVIEFVRASRGWPSLDSIAMATGVPKSALTAGFRRRMGCTLGDFLRATRTDQAATALALSDEPISRIAFRLGFSDQSHLTRLMRERFGSSPGAFRKLLTCATPESPAPPAD